MSAAPNIPSTWGVDLTDQDLTNLAKRFITPAGAQEAGFRRVDSITGAQMFNRTRKNCAGLIIPNLLPGEESVREYRLRLDQPELEHCTDGTVREIKKYLQPTERRNLIYFPPGVTPEMLLDLSIPVIVTEGEFKGVALWRLARHESKSPRFLPIAVSGVWNWHGTVGKTTGSNGERHDVKGVVPDVDRIAWTGRQVIIAFDADAGEKSGVRAARSRLTAALIERGAVVGFLEWPISEGKGIDDRLVTVGQARVLADIDAVEFGGWRTRLLHNSDGKVISCCENVALHLERSDEWAGVLGYNEFTAGHVVLRQPPSPITAKPGHELEDHFDIEVVRWFDRKYITTKPDVVRRVVDSIARRNSFHPVRDYLESLPAWDGVPRIGTWLIDYCGVESSDEEPNHYAMAVGSKFLISAVARVLNPGCKADHLLILEGPQGIGKSSAVRILASAGWFVDQLADMGSKDACMQLRGRWIVELSELDVLNRADMSRAKAFITQQTDRFRPPYGHRVIEAPRQCVFIGTTNSDSWLRDETGGRRFWPVRCRKIDLGRLAADRNQLWAEALSQYRANVHWWLEDAEVIEDATEEQRGRYLDDPWQQKVVESANDVADLISSGRRAGSAAVHEILQRLGVDLPKQDQSMSNRVARCLKRAGWERKRVGPKGAREWRYKKVCAVGK